MKNMLLVFLCLFFYQCAAAQTQQDSLILKAGKSKLDSAQQVLQQNKFSEVQRLCEEALVLYQQDSVSYLLPIADTYYQLGELYWRTEQNEKALQYLNKALPIFLEKRGPKTVEVTKCRNIIANTYYNQGQFQRAIEIHDENFKNNVEEWGTPQMVSMSYNNKANCYTQLGDFTTAIALHEKALQIRQTKLPDNFAAIGQSLQNIGFCYYRIGEYYKALDYYEHARAYYIKAFGENHLFLAYIDGQVSQCYFDLKEFKKALEYSLKAKNKVAEVFGEENPDVAEALVTIGNCYLNTNEFERAKLNYDRALAIKLKAYGENHPSIAIIYINIGNYYHVIGEDIYALNNSQKALAIFKALNIENHFAIPVLLKNRGDAYSSLGEYQKAGQQYKAALEKQQELQGLYAPKVGDIYFQIGDNYFTQTILDSAAYFAKQALMIHDTALQKENPYSISDLNLLTTIETIRGNLDEAMTHSEEGMRRLKMIDATMGEALYLKERSEFWERRGAVYLAQYRKTGNKKMLRDAYDCFQITLQTNQKIRANLLEDQSKANISTLGYKEFDKSIVIANILQDYKVIFSLIEDYKAQVILENSIGNTIKSLAGMPDSLLENEYSLRAKVSFLEQQLANIEFNKDQSDQVALYQQIFDSKQQLENLRNTLQQKYPAYRQYTARQKTPALLECQQKLNPQTAMLEYFVGDSTLTIITLTNNKFQVWQKPRPHNLESDIETFRHFLANENAWQDNQYCQDHIEKAWFYYQLLLKEPLEYLGSTTKSLIIIPDAALGLIPFEVLLQQKVPVKTLPKDAYLAFGRLPFLIKNYQISYAYSAGLLLEQQKIQPQAAKLFGGFAPIYTDVDTSRARAEVRIRLTRGGNFDLKSACEEVQQIADLLQGDAYLAAQATEPAFRNSAGKYRILHLAMHGIPNPRFPQFSKFLFTAGDSTSIESDGDLTANDLYAMRLNAELAVLSACETGVGKIQRGEGILSLSYAFAYAGVPSIVMSLWNADDEQTLPMMVNFYKNLKTGLPKDQALRKAKLAYLQNAAENQPEFCHPYFWANFVPLGDMRPVKMK